MADPVTEFEVYRQELLAALAGDDPVVSLRRSFDEISALIDTTEPAQMERAPAAGEWSAWQVLSHLGDADLIVGARVRLIVTSDRPVLVGYDQDAFTARFGGLDLTVGETAERWRALRLANLRIFESLSDAEWHRVGVHSERGEESALLTVELMAGHDRVHVDQIRRAAAGGG